MTIARSASEVLSQHVTLEVEGIDRMYLNLYVPILQRPRGVGHFWINHRGHQFASSVLMAPMTDAFVSAIKNFAKTEGIDVVPFRKRQDKDELAQKYLAKFPAEEGVLFIGKAQEKTPVVRTEKRRNPRTGQSTSTSSDSWPGRASPSRLSTTACSLAPTRSALSASATS